MRGRGGGGREREEGCVCVCVCVCGSALSDKAREVQREGVGTETESPVEMETVGEDVCGVCEAEGGEWEREVCVCVWLSSHRYKNT